MQITFVLPPRDILAIDSRNSFFTNTNANCWMVIRIYPRVAIKIAFIFFSFFFPLSRWQINRMLPLTRRSFRRALWRSRFAPLGCGPVTRRADGEPRIATYHLDDRVRESSFSRSGTFTTRKRIVRRIDWLYGVRNDVATIATRSLASLHELNYVWHARLKAHSLTTSFLYVSCRAHAMPVLVIVSTRSCTKTKERIY